MNRLRSIGVLIIASLVQFTLVSRLEVFGVSANLFIPITIIFAIGFGEFRGAYTGMFFGLLEDILFSNIIGPRALAYFLLGLLVGSLNYRLNIKDKKTGALITALATGLLVLVSLGISSYIGMETSLQVMAKMILIESFLNSILYYLLMKIFTRIFVFPDIVFYR